MVVLTDSLHKLAKLNYFKHSPDLVVVGGTSFLLSFNLGNGFVGRYVCKIAAQSGLIPVSISVDPCPPVYSADDSWNHSWITKVSGLLF